MQFTSFLENGRLTVALSGEIDHHCAKQYIQAIGAKVEAYTPEICILDFEEVTFMDSSGIAVVINALREITQIEIDDLRPYFPSGYTNGQMGYMPTLEAWRYTCYESDTTGYAPGTAELIAHTQLEMLKELKMR